MYKNTARTNTEFSNVVEYKINIQNSIAFLYTSNKHMDTNYIYTKSPNKTFTKCFTKHLCVNLINVQDLHAKNYTMLIKEIEDMNKCAY